MSCLRCFCSVAYGGVQDIIVLCFCFVFRRLGYPAGADPGFQVRGGVLKKIAPSGGRRENIWGRQDTK
jgi:hypothetical protein